MSALEKALKGLGSSSDATPTDVAMKLLDEESALMHTEIRNVKMMNELKLAVVYYNQKGWTKCESFFATLYNANIVHMVTYKRQRPKEIAKMFSALQAMYGMPTSEGRSGLFGGSKK